MNVSSSQQVSSGFNSLLMGSPTTRDMILIIIGSLIALLIGKKVKSSNCRTPIGTLSLSFWNNVTRSGRNLVGQESGKEVEIPKLEIPKFEIGGEDLSGGSGEEMSKDIGTGYVSFLCILLIYH